MARHPGHRGPVQAAARSTPARAAFKRHLDQPCGDSLESLVLALLIEFAFGNWELGLAKRRPPRPSPYSLLA
jgi:hypothetical protein